MIINYENILFLHLLVKNRKILRIVEKGEIACL